MSISRYIYEELKEKIVTQHYDPGCYMESEVVLSRIYRVNRHTIRKVTDRLANEGYITKNFKKPATINEIKMTGNYFKYDSIYGFVKKEEVITKILLWETISSTPELEKHFNNKQHKKYYKVVRLRSVDDKAQMERIFMPVSLFPNFKKKDAESSIYKYIEENYCIPRRWSDKLLKVHYLSDEEKKIFKTSESACIKISNKGYLENGRMFEYSETLHLNQSFRLHQKG